MQAGVAAEMARQVLQPVDLEVVAWVAREVLALMVETQP
jgi:hypothetical protein